MSSTLCTTFESNVHQPHTDYSFSRNSNTAGAPLPLIPRRSPLSRTHHVHALIHTPTPISSSAPASMLIQTPTSLPERPQTAPPISPTFRAEDSDSSSTSSSPSDDSRPTIVPRAKRIRSYRMPAVCPPELSTPIPSQFNVSATATAGSSLAKVQSMTGQTADGTSDDETPRPSQQQRLIQAHNGEQLRVHLDVAHARNLSESPLSAIVDIRPDSLSSSTPVDIPAAAQTRLIRKKSGEPLRSSLKSMKRPPRGSISVVTGGISSKSEPNTPTQAKYVHFDAQLEHVKLFLAEQKPLAVSRDGSPTDTSGTDSEFPSFIFGSASDEERLRKALTMQVVNMPKTVPQNAEVALQSLTLSSDKTSVIGQVRVRNLAFEKWLAVRFTFDWWQTTSEVTAKYIESREDGKFDIFGFTIRLQDILSRIEEKSLFLALRYTVDGKEIWDNNGGANYLAKFSKKQPASSSRGSGKKRDSGESDMVNLRMKLEKVAQGRNRKANFLAHASQASPESEKPPSLKADTSLSSRYDFSAALRSPWKGGRPPSPPRHIRTLTHPSSPNTIPWPQKTPPFNGRSRGVSAKQRPVPIGSPRDPADDAIRPAPHVSSPDDPPFPIPVRQRGSRNHQRGYFDVPMADASGIKRTPPGTPHLNLPDDSATSLGQHQRFNSYPPVQAGRPTSPFSGQEGLSTTWSDVRQAPQGGSEESTPTITSPSSSSRSSSPSPAELSPEGRKGSPNNDNQYSVFLNRFCFYTGSDSLMDVPTDLIPRSQSASSVEELLSSQSPPLGFQREYLTQFSTPTRSSSFDDVAHRSGSSTPTARNYKASDSRSSTPVA